MWPFDAIGSSIGDLIASAFDAAMTAIWQAALDLLRAALTLADQFSVFSVSTTSGPIKIVWPMMLWISGVLAMALFFWQLVVTNLRAGRGFLRLVVGPVQYGVALAVTVGLVAGFLAAVDGLTGGILRYGLDSDHFSDSLAHTSLAGAAGEGIKAVVLGICALAGLVPAAVGYVLEMLFREAAIYVLVGSVPVAAAGLLANVTARWFWRLVRWLLAAIVMKPVLALALVIGVAVAGGSQGVSGLLAGVGVLVISLIAPFVLFRLFAFVDPNSDQGAAVRDFFSGMGLGSYGSDSPVGALASSVSGTGTVEKANTGRFDAATDEAGDLATDAADHTDGDAEPDHSAADDIAEQPDERQRGADASPPGRDPDDGDPPRGPDDDEPPEPPAPQGDLRPDNGPSGPTGGGAAGGAAAAGEAGVIV